MHATESVTNIDLFATLIRKKLLLPSNKTPYTVVKMSFLVELLRSRVGQIHVDESWYLNRKSRCPSCGEGWRGEGWQGAFCNKRLLRASSAI